MKNEHTIVYNKNGDPIFNERIGLFHCLSQVPGNFHCTLFLVQSYVKLCVHFMSKKVGGKYCLGNFFMYKFS